MHSFTLTQNSSLTKAQSFKRAAVPTNFKNEKINAKIKLDIDDQEQNILLSFSAQAEILIFGDNLIIYKYEIENDNSAENEDMFKLFHQALKKQISLSSCSINEQIIEQQIIIIDMSTQLQFIINQKEINHQQKLNLENIKDQCIKIEEGNFENKYRVSKFISSGSQAKLYLSKVKNFDESLMQSHVAVKEYNILSDFQYKQILNEIGMLRQLYNCQNITQLHEVYQDEKSVKLVMEYAEDGDLLTFIEEMNRPIPEEKIRILMLQLLITVDYIHKQGIIHRDLKPDNVLLQDRHKLEIQIADFGLACRVDDIANKKIKSGTPGFMAPEVLKGEDFSVKSDVFSLGCIFYMMIFRRNLFQAKTLKQLILVNTFKDPIDLIENQTQGHVSAECIQLLNKMLQKNENNRFSIEECLMIEIRMFGCNKLTQLIQNK
eukprot:403338806